DFQKGRRGDDDYEESEPEESIPQRRHASGRGAAKSARSKVQEDIEMEGLDDDDFVVSEIHSDKHSKAKKPSRPKKRKSEELDEDRQEVESPRRGRGRPSASAKSTPAKAKPQKKAKNEPVEENSQMK